MTTELVVEPIAVEEPSASLPTSPPRSALPHASTSRFALMRIVGRRVFVMIPMLFGIVTVTFLLTHAVAGNPAKLIAGQFATPKAVAAISKEYGFDDSLIVQYWHYLYGIFHGNLGVSTTTGHSVMSDLLTRIPSTLELVVLILSVSMAIGIPLGAYAGRSNRKSAQMVVRALTFVLLATPDFWLGLVAIFVLYFKLNLLPAPTGQLSIGVTAPHTITGAHLLDSILEGNGPAFRDTFLHLILPVSVVGLCLSAPITRLMRSATIAVMESDAIKFARAMGLSGFQIWRYAVRSALPPAVTFAGTVFTLLIGGLVLIESVFSWGGAASYAAAAIQSQDFDATQGFVLFCGLASVFAFLVVDLIQMGLDPRVRLQNATSHKRRVAFGRPSRRNDLPPATVTAPMSRRRLGTGAREFAEALVEIARDINPREAPRALRRFLGSKNYVMFFGLAIVASLILASFIIPAISPYGVLQSSLNSALQAPSEHHLFGTDQAGFDVFVRVAYAARLDITVAAEGVGIAVAIGVLLGVAIGFSRRRIVDELSMRIVDMIQAFPLLIVAVTIVAFAGNHLINVVGAIGFVNAPLFLRLTRTQVLTIRELRFVEAATALGNTRSRIVLRHIIPNSLGPIIVQMGAALGYAIITIAGLAFLGVGIEAPTPEWGSMILTGREGMATGQWWTVVFPGVALLIAVIGFNLFAEGVEKARDIYR